mmetsp:Transcript_40905/g.131551  ORF Transcript_40905/g.131551 Transcript_40905/m.131551 type:complete len:112 (+) Transcript_40905:81-416(+)
MFECNICLEAAAEPVVTRCGHLFCWACLHQWLNAPQSSQEAAGLGGIMGGGAGTGPTPATACIQTCPRGPRASGPSRSPRRSRRCRRLLTAACLNPTVIPQGRVTSPSSLA